MKIRFECKISKMVISSANERSIEITLLNEITICGMKRYIAYSDNKKNQVVLIELPKILIENATDYFDFISMHSREVFIIIAEKTAKETGNENKEPCQARINGECYKIESVELVYG